MSAESRELRQMKMEMLRMRGELQRSEMRMALGDLRSGARRGRGLLNAVGGLSAGMVAHSGWVGVAAALLRRPWAVTLGLAALRTLKRHPMLVVGALTAGAAALGVGREVRVRASRRHKPGEDVFSAPIG